MLHIEDGVARTEGKPREILQCLLPKLRQANRDKAEDFQDISTCKHIRGRRSLFEMAPEVGLEDMEHWVMIPASSALHGDWAAKVGSRSRPLHSCSPRPSCDPRADYAEQSTEEFPFLAERIRAGSIDELLPRPGV